MQHAKILYIPRAIDTINNKTLQKKIELLAPGGDVDSIKAAIAAGADAIYCGINKFNARNRASNISLDELNGILRLAHNNHCEVFLTLNILILESEIPDLIRLLNKLVNTSIDGVIIQDLGLFHILSSYFKSLKIHASTQVTSHNEGQIKFLSKLNTSRINLSRELNLKEIKSLSAIAHQHNILTEVFVHGSYCISFSGLCYMSSSQNGNSGNRGRCSQPCRDRYVKTPSGNQYPLNLKDNSAWADLKDLSEADVDSMKIEGRIKKSHYVYSVVKNYRKQLDRLRDGKKLLIDHSSLKRTFNRGFSNGFLKGEISQDMFIENPRDQSSTKQEEFEEIKAQTNKIIEKLSIDKAPLLLSFSGEANTPLKLEIKTPDSSLILESEKRLSNKGTASINEKDLLKRFKAINDTAYFIDEIDLSQLQTGLHIPYGELSSLKNKAFHFLSELKENIAPIILPPLDKIDEPSKRPALFALISSPKDLTINNNANCDIFFQLPNSIPEESTKSSKDPELNSPPELVSFTEFRDFFLKNKKITPWFPSILIGKDFDMAIQLLKEIKAERIVTDNTGIAYEAYKQGIPWVAGPQLNLTNSYSLIALKENFNCAGAFISKELSKRQISGIKKPTNFELYYSIYHPVELMISRQCFFHQVTGCEKDKIDSSCLPKCQKGATIENSKGETFFIDKKHGCYMRIYGERNYMNTLIPAEFPRLFEAFLIDLRNIHTNTITPAKADVVIAFRDLLNNHPEASGKIKTSILNTTNSNYTKGI